MNLRCPICHRVYQCSDSDSGRTFPCSCGRTLRIPNAIEHYLNEEQVGSTTPERSHTGLRRFAWLVVSILVGVLAIWYIATDETLRPVKIAEPSPPPVSCVEGKAPDVMTTGARIFPDEDTLGESSITIENGTDSEAVIRVAWFDSGKSIRFVYVGAHQDYTIRRIGAGLYTLNYQLGHRWIAECFDSKVRLGMENSETCWSSWLEKRRRIL